VQTLREHLAYVRGLAESRRLNAAESHDPVLSELLNLIGEVVEKINHLEAHLQPSAERGAGGGSGEARNTASDALDSALSCPSCRQRLAISRDLLAEESFEVTCPECSLLLQVM
jgi:hypothetical protein